MSLGPRVGSPRVTPDTLGVQSRGVVEGKEVSEKRLSLTRRRLTGCVGADGVSAPRRTGYSLLYQTGTREKFGDSVTLSERRT